MNEKVQKQIEFRSTLERSTNKLWGYHFLVPTKVTAQLMSGASRRVVCTLNDTATYQCALLPHGNGRFVITVNKTLRAKLQLGFGDNVRVRLQPDTTKYGLPLPEELKALLRQDTEGNTLFHALTKGRQRTLLYIIGQVKDPDKRLRRAVTVINHLKTNNGIINYKQLSLLLRAQHPRI
jgi:hypothetical protein